MNQDTICAIATPMGGAIGIIRISGPQAIEIADRIFVSVPSGKKLAQLAGYTLTFGHIKKKEEIIDEVLVSVFRAPHSYTGENSVEITCHGSSYILQKIIQLLLWNGCRSALPGEYTQRAFLNGKMDLSQAEAVADLIASSSETAHRLAMNQMRGGFSKEIAALREQLLSFTSMIELELDFGEEDVEFANRKDLRKLAGEIERIISRLAHSFKVGNAIKNGVPVAIIGETNAGKSTLLNVLLNEDKAIVSEIHGTTRDVIEDTVNIGDVLFRFIDTAGLRETQDVIETLGIERTYKKISQAEIILWMMDATEARLKLKNLSQKILPLCKDKKLVLLFNKSEFLLELQQEELSCMAEELKIDYLFISAKQQTNIDKLKDKLVSLIYLPDMGENEVIVTNLRHYEALVRALDSICRVQQGLSQNLSGDLLSQDLRECIFHLSDIMGEVTTDEVLGTIFKNFCIGK